MKLNIGSGKNRIDGMVNVDIDDNSQPDIVCDATDLPFKAGSVDEVVLNAVLEHCKQPQALIDEIYRVLKKNGKVIGWCPFLTGYHGNKEYGDYFRFTGEGIAVLFWRFGSVSYAPAKGYCETMLNLSPLPKGLSPLARQVDKHIKSDTVSGFNFEVVK